MRTIRASACSAPLRPPEYSARSLHSQSEAMSGRRETALSDRQGLIDRNKNRLDDSLSGSLRTSVPELCTASKREVWGSELTAKAPPRDARLTGGQLTSRRCRRRRCSRRHKSRRVESLARKSIVSGVPSQISRRV